MVGISWCRAARRGHRKHPKRNAILKRKAFIAGVTGQDGSYLAELLLEKDYKVYGLIRRSSSFNTGRIDHIFNDVELVYGDLTDGSNLSRLLRTIKPTEIYNLAAQSHVRVSFDIPEYTADVVALGTLRLLDAVRDGDLRCRFYQAGSSEMFGQATAPQNEATPFQPRSPYGVGKVFAHWITRNYREAYNMYAVNGILFNHECVPAHTPVVVRNHGLVDISPIEDLIPHRTNPHSGTRYCSDGGGLEIWDGFEWTICTARTATWHSEVITTLHGRGAVIEATNDHVMFGDGGTSEVPFGEVQVGDSLWLGEQPTTATGIIMNEAEASLLGFICAEGWISTDGNGRVVCGDESVLADVESLWREVAGGYVTREKGSQSAFSDARTPSLRLNGNCSYLRMIRDELYSFRSGDKRIPKRVLNAKRDAQMSFLHSYNRGDGLRAGNGTDEYKSFRTTSPALACGLTWLARTVMNRRVSMYLQPGSLGGGNSYLINLSSGSMGDKGKHLQRPQDEIRKITYSTYTGWMFDLATVSNRFAAGAGLAVIHNSPRRGETFVTRKITKAVGAILRREQQKLVLGNLQAKRDWGYAKDYMDAVWRMMQRPLADDFVIATGETHTVKEWLEEAFSYVDLSWQEYVVQDERYFRPTEIDLLVGDAQRAHTYLGWYPTVKFKELVRMMVDADR